MVFPAQILRSFKEGIQRPFKRKFLDSLRLHVSGGAGGMGLPKYGGIGGNGGSVYIKGKDGLTLKDTVNSLKSKRIHAKGGENSHKKSILGAPGEDLIIETPLGVTAISDSGSLGEVNREGEKVLIARGGVGGNPKTKFCGTRGESHTVVLDLKIIADIGLVGFPNAGKSTMLSILSNAKPKIASYPFTTIEPNIGILNYSDGRTMSMADLPGLTEGAHANIGMGHKFLKHVLRTPVLLFVVDVGGFRLNQKYRSRSALETIILLTKELELYKEELLDKPAVLIINKMDKKGSSQIYDELISALDHMDEVLREVPEELRPLKTFNFDRILKMSAIMKNPHEIDEVKEVLRNSLDRSCHVSRGEDHEADLIQEIDSKISVKGPALI